jgi:hypothetical protein
MSSTAWARRFLSPATLHPVISTVLYRCVTRPVAVADRWPTTLTPGCSRPAFNGPPTAHLASVRSSPCRVVSWKIRAYTPRWRS